MPLEKCEEGMHRFVVERVEDSTGVSGTGIVIEGIVFSTGQCVIHWLTPAPRGSIGVWDSFAAFESVHIAPHPENKTKVHWYHDNHCEDEATLSNMNTIL